MRRRRYPGKLGRILARQSNSHSRLARTCEPSSCGWGPAVHGRVVHRRADGSAFQALAFHVQARKSRSGCRSEKRLDNAFRCGEGVVPNRGPAAQYLKLLAGLVDLCDLCLAVFDVGERDSL